MVDKAKKRLMALAAERGIGRRTAGNLMAQRRPPPGRGYGGKPTVSAAMMPIQPVPVELGNLLAELGTGNVFSVLTGRLPATSGSGDYAVAREQAARLLQNPLWYAETGGIKKTVTREQHDQLVGGGAADDTKIQMIRSFFNDGHVTFSERCRRCRRWLWCGEREAEGQCFCGAAYRIAFDLPEISHWSQRHGWLCMDCGKEQLPREWVGPRQPWQVVNERQVQCDPCYQKQPARTAFAVRGEQASRVQVVPRFDAMDPRNKTTRLATGAWRDPVRPVAVINGTRETLVWISPHSEGQAGWRIHATHQGGTWPLDDAERAAFEHWVELFATKEWPDRTQLWPVRYEATREAWGHGLGSGTLPRYPIAVGGRTKYEWNDLSVRGGDFQETADGDLKVVSGPQVLDERIERAIERTTSVSEADVALRAAITSDGLRDYVVQVIGLRELDGAAEVMYEPVGYPARKILVALRHT